MRKIDPATLIVLAIVIVIVVIFVLLAIFSLSQPNELPSVNGISMPYYPAFVVPTN